MRLGPIFYEISLVPTICWASTWGCRVVRPAEPERPVSEKLQAMGVPNPPPLRSATFPLGLPQLSPFHRAKVESANKLYRLAVEIFVYCYKRRIVVSIENPANSWLWAALVRITAELSIEASTVWKRWNSMLAAMAQRGTKTLDGWEPYKFSAS